MTDLDLNEFHLELVTDKKPRDIKCPSPSLCGVYTAI